MSQKSKPLKILNERRLLLKENMEAFVRERNRLQRRLNLIDDHIEAADVELVAIDIQLSAFAKKENFDVKMHIIHGEHDTNNPKLMVEIKLDNHPPIFKLLSQYDFCTCSSGSNPTDKFLLKSRLIEVVEDWLSNDRSISRLFSEIDEKFEDALDNYVDDNGFERKIRRAASFFPLISND